MNGVDYPELVTRSRRAAGFSDRVTDQALIERVAAMVRSTPSRPSRATQAGADRSEVEPHEEAS